MTEEPATPAEPAVDDAAQADPFHGPEWHPAGFSTRRSSQGRDAGRPAVRVKISRRKKRSLRRRRRIGLAMVVVGGAILLAGLWIVITGLFARSQLNDVRAEMRGLRADIAAGNLPAARSAAASLARHAHRAHVLTSGPVWAAAASIPDGGEPLQVVRQITAAADSLGQQALPKLVAASVRLDPKTLRSPSGAVNLAAFASATPDLNAAHADLVRASQVVRASTKRTWLPFIDSARSDVVNQLNSLTSSIRSAQLAARIAPALLGADGPKEYFVAFQNEAEARGTGGLPGAFGILSADRGKLKFVRFESDTLFGSSLPTGINFGREYNQLYHGAGTTSDYRNTNLSPHFPYAAQVWVAMWRQYSGQRLDGAFALDPTVLSYLLAVTGPARSSDGTVVTARNVVWLTESGVYARFGSLDPASSAARKKYLLDIASATSAKVLKSQGRPTRLLRAAARAAGERRLLMWSADPAVESLIAQTSLSGAIPVTRRPYVGLSIVNDGGNKLDFYLKRRLTWQRSGCGPTRQVTVAVTLTNTAPSGLPPYVVARSDSHAYRTKPGDNRLEVSYLATSGARMASVDIDGRAATAGAGSQLGHPLYTVDLELPRGATGTVTLHLIEPAGRGSPIILRQPLVLPLAVSIKDARC